MNQKYNIECTINGRNSFKFHSNYAKMFGIFFIALVFSLTNISTTYGAAKTLSVTRYQILRH